MRYQRRRREMKKSMLFFVAVVALVNVIACGPAEVHHHWNTPAQETDSGSEKQVDDPKKPPTPVQPKSKEKTPDEGYDMTPSYATEKSCKENSNCWNGAMCIGGSCVVTKHKWKCAVHADCQDGLICNWGQCVKHELVGFKTPEQHECTHNRQCSVLNNRSFCEKGVCGTNWSKEQGVVKGCEVYYDSHADHFKLSDDKGRFKNNTFKVVILAFKDDKPYVAVSKTTFYGPYMTINIPDWATGFMLINHKGYKTSMYECIGKFSAFMDFHDSHKMSGSWLVRNNPK